MRIKSIICGALIVVSAIFTMMFFPIKESKNTHFYSPEYKGILTIWQVDSFEGGIGSRKQFLLKVARSYEKNNLGLLIMVIDHTFESVKEAISKGECPDIISYGVGTELLEIQPMNTDRFFKGGALNKTLYALPWCRGGYCIISRENVQVEKGEVLDKIVLSKTGYTQPALALYLEGITAHEYVEKPPLEAYVDFVGGKTDYLLGTQRDIMRLTNRGVEFNATPIKEYNDLYQYASITAKDKNRIYYANDFINYLTSALVQEKLTEIGMLSCFENIEYQNKELAKLKNIAHNYTVSAFVSGKTLVEMHNLALISLKGDKESEIKIKNMLI